MFRVWSVTVVYTVLVIGMSVMAAWATLRNWRTFQQVRRRLPLEVTEVLTSEPSPMRPPPAWPPPSELQDFRLAAAYRDYALERRDMAVLLGELLVVAGGAAFGASLPAAAQGGWHTWPSAGTLLLGALGLLFRTAREARWSQMAALYERRRTELGEPASDDPARDSPRSRWRLRVRRR